MDAVYAQRQSVEVSDTFPVVRIGYGRVSTTDQNPDGQRDALTAARCEQIFLDQASGKLAARPDLDKALLVANRPGDQLVVTKLDRLAVGRVFFQILGAIAEFEHALMSERTRDVLAAARARGRTGGQKPKLGPRQVRLAQQTHDEHGKHRCTAAQIAAEFGVTRPTIYRYLHRAGKVAS